MDSYSRHINFEGVLNFRDLGGYRTREGHMVVWRRLFRSGEMHYMTGRDLQTLKEEIGLTTVIDLRSTPELNMHGTGLLSEAGVRYYNMSLISDGGDREANERRYRGLKNMGEFYFLLVQQKEVGKRIIEALEVIAEPANHPLVFHCSAGKDRTGIIAAFLLSILRVADEDIIEDYSLSSLSMEKLLDRIKSNPQMAEDARSVPGYFWQAGPELMEIFLTTLKEKYGSVRGYLEEQGAEASLFERLEKALLV